MATRNAIETSRRLAKAAGQIRKSTPATRKAKRAPGNAAAQQARVNDKLAKQHAKARGVAETITSAVNARTGNGMVVTTSRDRSIVVTRVDGTVNKLAQMGKLVEPLEQYLKTQPKPQAKLARGVEGKMTENSRAAYAAQKGNAKGGKAAEPKAAKNKAPARGTDRSYTRGKAEIKAKPDSWRGYMLGVICKHTDTAAAKAAHAKAGKFAGNKLDFNWAAAQGYISWTK